jgi:hypothetical protein
MKKNILFLAMIILVPTILYILSLENVIPLPSDDAHLGIKDEIDCFECHGEGKEHARKKDHPPKDKCFICHKNPELIKR